MQFHSKSRADWRALTGFALIGAGMGLTLGAGYLAAGLGAQAADHARAEAFRDALAARYEQAFEPIADAAAPVPAGASKSLRKQARAAKPRRDLDCLAEAVYYEARGEGAQGQFAVAQVVMNRVHHPAFPKTVCGVVYQGAGHRGCQFSFACDGSRRGARREASAWVRARRVAARALSGVAIAEVGSATHFHTTGVAPAWGPQMRRVAQVGMHVFYRFNPRRPGLSAPVQQAALTASPTAEASLEVLPSLVEKASDVAAPAAAEAAPADAKPAAQPSEAALKAPQPAAEATS